MPSQGIFTLAIPFPALEGLENLLEEGGQFSSRRHSKIAPKDILPPTFMHYQVARRGGAWGVLSKGGGAAI